MTELEERLGYEFSDPSLLAQALTSPACRMDHPEGGDNQRLEFLGDAVFGLLAAERVFATHPEESEGALTVRRAHLVSGAFLAEVAERVGLRRHLRRNAGSPEPLPRAKCLADAMEAVMGAVWLDGGRAAAARVFETLGFADSDRLGGWRDNPKGRLQILAQAMRPARKPAYAIDSVTGPAHAPRVKVTVRVPGLGTACGEGGSNRAAECAAASALLAELERKGDGAAMASVRRADDGNGKGTRR